MSEHKTMRILAGRYKNRPLLSPENQSTHPMGAREKNALFNMLQPYLADAAVLDLYAGTGALGLEALSRGAREAVFVEASGPVARVLNANLDRVLGPDFTSAQVYVGKDQDFLKLPNYTSYFDLIIADPPYNQFQPAMIAEFISFLKPQGILALSYPHKLASAPDLPGLTLIKQRSYAAAGIALYQKNC